jgi:hypothetical protein
MSFNGAFQVSHGYLASCSYRCESGSRNNMSICTACSLGIGLELPERKDHASPSQHLGSALLEDDDSMCVLYYNICHGINSLGV